MIKMGTQYCELLSERMNSKTELITRQERNNSMLCSGNAQRVEGFRVQGLGSRSV